MKTATHRAGFSLMEVNMAVFVMAVGILSMVVLYPLGLRESTQGQADLKQAMFGDYVLNQAVAAASDTNLTWSEWKSVNVADADTDPVQSVVPNFISSKLKLGPYNSLGMQQNVHYKIGCFLVPGASDKIMGILVQSTDLVKAITKFEQVTNNPIFYAEVMFQGDPTR